MRILKVKTSERKIGDRGEELAAKHLRKSGYKILERNYAESGYEIDIVAENREALVFVEVKTRIFDPTRETLRPALAVTPEKQRKIISAANFYRSFRQTEKPLRLDVIEVLLENGKQKQINHMEGAFNYNTAFGIGKI